jgi:formate-dependent nitrite reductase membrane component NrfD
MEGQVIANAFQNAYWGFPIALYFWLIYAPCMARFMTLAGGIAAYYARQQAR